MNFFSSKKQKGFTLIELILVVFIVGLMATVVIYNLAASRNSQILNNGEGDIVALINEARSRTVAAENNLQYGVHFETTKVELFSGTTYTSGALGNKKINLDSNVTIPSISLSGGASDVVFKKMTGETDVYGTIILKNTSNSNQKTITISKTGIVNSD